MADSNITVDSLTIASGFDYNIAKWTFTDPNANGIEQCRLNAVELLAAETNDRGPDDALLAVKVDEGRDKAAHMALVRGVTRYYWVRPRNNAGFYGDWYPSSPTEGVQATTTLGFALVGWSPFTTPLLAGSGSITSGSVNGAYSVMGDLCFVNAQIDIVTNGTGSDYLAFDLPVLMDDNDSAFNSNGGGMMETTHKALQLINIRAPSSKRCRVRFYDGTYPGVDGGRYFVSVAYKIDPAGV